MSDLQQQIKKMLEESRQIERIHQHFSDLDKRLSYAYGEQERLTEVLEKEYKDITELEKLNLKSIFHKVLGSKEQQLEQERQEYLQASLKYDEHKKTVELLEYEKKVLLEKLNRKKNLEGELDNLLQRRERELMRNNSVQGVALLTIQKTMEQHQLLLMEIRQAVPIGQDALDVLEKMIIFLRGARNWGQWDRSRRGRRHSNIDRAREQAIYAQQLLRRFKVELRDIYKNVPLFQLNWEKDAFNHFLDVFFDNLISDWIIQQKIQNALGNVQAVRDQVLRMMEDLRNEEVHCQTEIKQLQRQRRKLLEEG